MPEFPYLPQVHMIRQIAHRKKAAVYLVGGFLRDRVLGVPSADLDFAVSSDAIGLARAFARRIRGAFVLLDKEHGCARVVKKDQGVSAVYDFADFRAATLRGDLSHRDFTINTLALDVAVLDSAAAFDIHIKDPLSGLRDLQKKCIRMTAAGVFKEDPLRVLRGFSLQAQLGFTIERDTLRQMKVDAPLLSGVSVERISTELFKILASPRAAMVIAAMDRIGLLARIIPQVTCMYHCDQGGYHHLGVWEHSCEALKQYDILVEELRGDPAMAAYLAATIGADHSRAAVLRLAVLLHDIGKPETKRREAARMTFHGHEHAGAVAVRHIAKMLKLSTAERHALDDMVKMHLRPGYLANEANPTARAYFRYFRDTKDEAVSIALLAWADQRATCGPLTTKKAAAHHQKICRELISRYFRMQKEVLPKRLITGHDIKKYLKVPPSPLFKIILDEVSEAQALGTITTKKEAVVLARTIAVKKTPGHNDTRHKKKVESA